MLKCKSTLAILPKIKPHQLRYFHSPNSLYSKKTVQKSPIQEAFNFQDDEDDIKPKKKYLENDDEKPPVLNGLHKRWEKMSLLDQEEVLLYLEYRQRKPWTELNPEEKKAIWFISYGPWGPRAEKQSDPAKGYNTLMAIIGASLIGVTGYQLAKTEDKKV